MIEIKNISKSFSGQQVLHDVSLNIPKNETLLVVGQSGSGKSVLMKIIAGLLQADAGEVLIDGVNLMQCDRKTAIRTRQKLAMLFQGSALLDSLNVYQNVALPLFEHTKLSHQEIERQVNEKLSMVGLHDIFSKMPSELSGGMKKRVAFARAIITNPDYIIYDEPTTGLDPVISGEIIKLMIKLHKLQNIASIIVTHDLYCMQRIAGRMVMLADRQIIVDGNYNSSEILTDSRVYEFLQSEKG